MSEQDKPPKRRLPKWLRFPRSWPEVAHIIGYGLTLMWTGGYGLAKTGLVHSPDPLLLTAAALLIAVKRAGKDDE